jgi:hypothetical protein
VVLLWIAAAGALTAVVRVPGSSSYASAVLVALWLWGGLVYHATYFTRINPAAWGFAALFIGQAALLAGAGLPHTPSHRVHRRPRHRRLLADSRIARG